MTKVINKEKAKTKQKETKSSSKREAFVRLAEGRTASALQAIRLIGNLSNSTAYEYTDDDVRTMMSSIREELAAAEARFEAEIHKKSRSPVKFEL